MPEMPEVETVRRQIAPALEGRVFLSVAVDHGPRYGCLDTIAGQQIRTVDRRGKYLLLRLQGSTLVIHLGMSGQLFVLPADAPTGRFRRATFRLDDGRVLAFDDMRRFGTLESWEDGTPCPSATLAALGPEHDDPSFTPEHLHRALAASRRTLKASLLAQTVVAGLGNIYVDETLHRANLHPARRQLDRREAVRLHEAIRSVLAAAVAARGTTFSLYRDGTGREGDFYAELRVYDREGHPCRTCGTPIVKARQEGRGTHWCPRCQPEGKTRVSRAVRSTPRGGKGRTVGVS